MSKKITSKNTSDNLKKNKKKLEIFQSNCSFIIHFWMSMPIKAVLGDFICFLSFINLNYCLPKKKRKKRLSILSACFLLVILLRKLKTRFFNICAQDITAVTMLLEIRHNFILSLIMKFDGYCFTWLMTFFVCLFVVYYEFASVCDEH